MSIRSARRALFGTACLSLATFFASCQDSIVLQDDGSSDATTARDVRLSLSPLYVPDSVYWTLGSQNGAATVSVAPEDSTGARLTTVHFPLATAMAARDTLKTRFQSRSIQTARLFLVVGPDGSLQPTDSRIMVDTVGRALVKLLDSLKLANPTQLEVSKVYASKLLTGAPSFKGFPGNVPQGVSADSVRIQALIQVVAGNVPLADQARNWLLDLAIDSARAAIVRLVASGRINPSDTLALFPPPQIRMETRLTLDTVPRAGGREVVLHGTVVADSSIQGIQVSVASLSDGKDATGLFAPWLGDLLPKGTTRMALDTHKVSIQAASSLSAGTYVLRLRVIDQKYKDATFFDTFQVVPAVVLEKPKLTWIQPFADTIAKTTDSVLYFTYQVKVGGTSPIVSVKFNDHPAVLVGDRYEYTDTIAVRGHALPVKVRVENAQHSVVEDAPYTVTVPVSVGEALPVLARVDPLSAIGDTVPFEQGSRKISWKLADATRQKAMYANLEGLDGQTPLTVSFKDSTWSATVPLQPTGVGQTVRILAKLPSGNVLPVDSFVLVRRKDTTRPDAKLVPVAASQFYDVQTIQLQWHVRDNDGVDSVVVNGVRVKPTISGGDTLYNYLANLVPGANPVVLRAWDTAGNLAKDSQSITRMHNNDPPSVKRYGGTNDNVVEYHAVSSVRVAWIVEDKEKLDSVTIAGNKVLDSAGKFFSANIPLGAGENNVKIVAYGHFSGKTTSDSVNIRTRVTDPDGIEYEVALMPDHKVWMTGNYRVSASGATCGLGDCANNGRLYTWAQAMGLDASYGSVAYGSTNTTSVQGICPVGWHPATSSDWNGLFQATIPSGATDSTLALRSDTGWTSTAGTAVWGPFLHPNSTYQSSLILARSAMLPVGTTIDVGTVTTTPIYIPKTFPVRQALVWLPGEASATNAYTMRATGDGNYLVNYAKTALAGVRCVENPSLVVRPIGGIGKLPIYTIQPVTKLQTAQ